MPSLKSLLPVTIHIPPPPEYPPKKTRDETGIEPSQQDVPLSVHYPLIDASSRGRSHVGDVKLTLDDLKSQLMTYFGTLHEPEGVSVDQRLEGLKKKVDESPLSVHPSPLASLGEFPYPSAASSFYQQQQSTCTEEQLPRPLTLLPFETPHLGKNKTVSLVFPQDSASTQQISIETCSPVKKADESAPQDRQPISRAVQFSHHIKPPCPPPDVNYISSPWHHHDGAFPSHGVNEEEPSAWMLAQSCRSPLKSFSRVLEDLKGNVNQATQRLSHLGRVLDHEMSDPTLRSFQYLNCPTVKRRPLFAPQVEIQSHLLQLYQDLHAQVQWNERRIRALRMRMQTLQMNALASVALTRRDPRIAL